MREAEARGLVELRFRHRVDELIITDGAVSGVCGKVLEPSAVSRGQESSRVEVGEFELQAQAVVITSGGIGANHDLVRKKWPKRLGPPPQQMLSGVHGGADEINSNRMWRYVEGIRN